MAETRAFSSAVTSTRYAYSDKIKDRRRSLFPCEKVSGVDKFSDNLDLDCMDPLSSSDTECNSNSCVKDNLSLISSTQLISDILSTPKNRNYPPSEQSMSPLYLSPYGKSKKATPSIISPTKYLKTPNDSNVYSDVVPKLHRKFPQEQVASNYDSSNHPGSLSAAPKTSKVRTSLFAEFDVALAPKQFYPKIDSLKPCSDKMILLKQTGSMMNRNLKRKSQIKNKKRLSGQINAGVRHNIKKPKERKSTELKLSMSSVARIKTFKKDLTVNCELNGYLKDLAELNANREVKLIHAPAKNISHSIDNEATSNLKRPHNDVDDVTCKKSKLETNEINNSVQLDPTDLVNDDLEVERTQDINEILNLLDDSLGENKENKTKNDYDSHVVDHLFSETLLSPTSEMCNMASVMKIDSPKKVKNLNLLFQNMTDNNKDNQEAVQTKHHAEAKSQYFPIFSKNHKMAAKSQKVESFHKRKKPRISSNQMLLDAGQKRFGIFECSECNYVYNAGDPNDETMHENHHNATQILHFAGWKNEHILEILPNGSRIIVVVPSDSKIWIEKVKRVIEVINRDMGYYDMTLDISASKVFLFIMNKTIVGCLVAENKTRGYKVLTSNIEIDICSSEEYPLECGVSRIWVSPNNRKKGIATKLMDILKSYFIPGRLLNNCDIAFSSPTSDGKLFGAKYFKTSNFFTYFD